MADIHVTAGTPPAGPRPVWENEILEKVELCMNHARKPDCPGGSTFTIWARDGVFEVNVRKVPHG